jgi:hypothetical protein
MSDRPRQGEGRSEQSPYSAVGSATEHGSYSRGNRGRNQRRITLGGSGGPAVIDALAADGEVRGEQAATATGVQGQVLTSGGRQCGARSGTASISIARSLEQFQLRRGWSTSSLFAPGSGAYVQASAKGRQAALSPLTAPDPCPPRDGRKTRPSRAGDPEAGVQD